MRERDTKVYLGLLNDVRERMATGKAMPCVATRALEKRVNWGMNDVEIAYALSAPWQAGVTTVSVFTNPSGSFVHWVCQLECLYF